MAEREITVTNEVGLHARPAARFAKKAKEIGVDITVRKGDQQANAASLMSILKLDILQGDTVTLEADGDGADEAVEELGRFVEAL